MTHFAKNWKKEAALKAQQDDEDLELAFMKQVESFLQNKAKPIWDDNYRLGFEIVEKANNDDSRMIGIYAFRVGKDLYYAPAFFINGEIKGTDLLYSVRLKLFYPMNPDWANFILKNAQQESGTPEDRDTITKTPKTLNLREIAHPPFNTKAASVAWNEIKSTVYQKEIEDQANRVKQANFKTPKSSGLLSKFIQDVGNSALVKLANAVQDDDEFANNLFVLLDEEDYAPTLPQKQASTYDNKPLIVAHVGRFNPNSKIATTEQIEETYSIEDNRPNQYLKEVYEASDMCFENPGKSGIYYVPTVDCTFERCLILVARKYFIDQGSGIIQEVAQPAGGVYDNTDSSISTSYGDTFPETNSTTTHTKSLCIVHLPTKKTKDIGPKDDKRHMLAKYDTDINKYITEPGSIDRKNLNKGKAYIIYNPHTEEMTEPFYVVSRKKKGDLDIVNVTRAFTDEPYQIVFNPKMSKCLFDECIFNPDGVLIFEVFASKEEKEYPCDFIEFPEPDFRIAGHEIINEILIGDSDFRTGYVEKTANAYRIKLSGELTPELNKLGASLTLMDHCEVSEETAKELLEKADDAGTYSFLHKSATLQMEEVPDFYTTYNNEFDVNSQDHQSYVVRGYTDQSEIPEPRVGDVTQAVAEAVENVDLATPNELAMAAKQTGSPSVFEHGVVGSLAKTYDSRFIIEEYIPDMHQGLDKICRTLFLFYWRPEDFVELYGADDQSKIENMLISAVQSFGDLLLELKKKNSIDVDKS